MRYFFVGQCVQETVPWSPWYGASSSQVSVVTESSGVAEEHKGRLEMHQNLLKYRYNKYSQNGEDGIIDELCRRLDMVTGWFVEFGAWDGKHLSNTYNLLSNHGWRGVYIEGDENKYKDLLQTAAAFPGKVHTICAMVGSEGENKLDRLLARTPLPHDFDLLSIDIDSYDWQIWKSLSEYEPKMVLIESNSILPPGIFQLHDPPRHYGASFSSLVKLGVEKGYRLVCHTGNCFFVRNHLISQLGMNDSSLEPPERLFNRAKHYRERMIELGRKVLPQEILNGLFSASLKWKHLRRKR